MPTITALTAVERVSRRLKLASISSFTDPTAPVLLDFVNEAKREVLDTPALEPGA